MSSFDLPARPSVHDHHKDLQMLILAPADSHRPLDQVQADPRVASSRFAEFFGVTPATNAFGAVPLQAGFAFPGTYGVLRQITNSPASWETKCAHYLSSSPQSIAWALTMLSFPVELPRLYSLFLGECLDQILGNAVVDGDTLDRFLNAPTTLAYLHGEEDEEIILAGTVEQVRDALHAWLIASGIWIVEEVEFRVWCYTLTEYGLASIAAARTYIQDHYGRSGGELQSPLDLNQPQIATGLLELQEFIEMIEAVPATV